MFEAFTAGPLIIWTRLVFLLLGVWLAAEFFFRLASSAQLSLLHFRTHAIRYVLAFFLGGRLFAILAEYRVYLRDPLRIFVAWDGNFSFLGGAIGVGFVLYLLTKSQRATFLQWLDVLLPATSFGLMFDWLGKFFSGRSYGKPTDGFFGITYESIGVRFAVPVHPVQLYYALFFFILTFLLLVIRKREQRAGSETMWGIVLASVATFILEYFRGDFGIPVFATKMDVVFLLALFVSLGIFALVELKLTKMQAIAYQSALVITVLGYMIWREYLPFARFELRFSQLLAIISLLAAVEYVLVHRRKYPHL